MTRVRNVAGAIGYALVGAALFGALGFGAAMVMFGDGGLEAVVPVVLFGGAGVVLGGVMGAFVSVYGGMLLEREDDARRDADADGSSPRL